MGLHDIEYNALAKFADIERAFQRAELSGITREPRVRRAWFASPFANREARRTTIPQAGIEVGG